MPKKEEEDLKKAAAKKGLTGKAADAYVYGTMRKQGWKPSTQKHADGGMVRDYANGGKIIHTGGMHKGKHAKPC